MNLLINARCLEGKRTGVGRYLSNLIRVWTEKSNDIHFDLYFRESMSNDEFLNCANVDSHVVRNSKMFDYGPIWENIYLPKALRSNRIDGVYFSPLYTLPALPISRKQVVTIFDISYIAHPEWFPKRQLVSLKLLTGSTVRKADIILTGSHATKNEILKYYDVDENKIHITNLGVEHSFLKRNNNNVDEGSLELFKMKYRLTGKVILFVGLIMNRRNVPVLMHAVSQVSKKMGEKLTLVIIGKNHSFPYINVQEIAYKLDMTDDVRFIHYTTDEEIFNFYKSADVFVCSSLYEGFNIPPLEALSLEVPVICSNLSSLPEVVGDAAFYLSDPRDVNEMSTALEKVLSDEQLRSELVERGKVQARKFSWERCAAETMDIIRTV